MLTRLKQYNKQFHQIPLSLLTWYQPFLDFKHYPSPLPHPRAATGPVGLHDRRRGPRRPYLGFVRRSCWPAALESLFPSSCSGFFSLPPVTLIDVFLFSFPI